MSFEKQVLAKVSNITTKHAIFVYGTLFVCCTPKEAAKIETMLIEEYKCGIIVTPQRHEDSEFSFDFC